MDSTDDHDRQPPPAGGFDTAVTVTGPWRSPAQMLGDQRYGGHHSVHDPATAGSVGLAGAPIEGPTHFSQFDPLAVLVWGQAWWEHGCISSHFQTMVVEGEQVRAAMELHGPLDGSGSARIEAVKADGSPVLVGTASVGSAVPTELDRRRGAQRPPGALFVVDQLQVGMRFDAGVAAVSASEPNGALYPFSLADKLAHITEPHPWYSQPGAASSPWRRAVVPMEMISVLAHKEPAGIPVRTPSLGLFLDLQVRLIDGPVFVDQPYAVVHEIVGLGESRRTESYWTRTTLTDVDRGSPVAEVLLHSGVFKASYPDYPPDRLA